MNIREFSHNLQKVYEEMGEVFANFQSQSKLPCLTGCGRCCQNPDVEASMMEMIPFALKIYDEGKLDEWIIRLENNADSPCALFQDHGGGKGLCSFYEQRPSVCRMFGVAGYFDKTHEATLSVCKYIRETYPEITLNLLKNAPQDIPMMANWFNHLVNIDPSVAGPKLPLNQAMLSALEKVAFLAQYQKV